METSIIFHCFFELLFMKRFVFFRVTRWRKERTCCMSLEECESLWEPLTESRYAVSKTGFLTSKIVGGILWRISLRSSLAFSSSSNSLDTRPSYRHIALSVREAKENLLFHWYSFEGRESNGFSRSFDSFHSCSSSYPIDLRTKPRRDRDLVKNFNRKFLFSIFSFLLLIR